MRFRKLDAFCQWAKSTRSSRYDSAAYTTKFDDGGSIFLGARRHVAERRLEMHQFIVLPRGQGYCTQTLNQIELALPGMHLTVSDIINARFAAFLMRRGYVESGKREVTLPAKVSRYQQRSA